MSQKSSARSKSPHSNVSSQGKETPPKWTSSPKVADRCVLESLIATPTDQNRRSHLEDNIILPGLSDPSMDTVKCSYYTAAVDDTVHYISPASATPLSARTVDEGGPREPQGYDYTSPSFMKYLHAYESAPEASYMSTTISCLEPDMQRTLAIVKPEFMKYEDVIVRAINEAGFTIMRKRYIHLTPEQVSEIFSQHYGSSIFPHMVVSMSVGPILSLCLGGRNAVEKWKTMVGQDRALPAEWFFPMSMRVRFGLQGNMPGAVHASECLLEANKENRYINPESVLEPIITDEEQVKDYCEMFLNPTLLNGLAEVVRIKPVDPILHLADWLLRNNPYQPRYPKDVSVLPT